MSKQVHNCEGETFPIKEELFLSQNDNAEIVEHIDNFKTEIIDSLDNLLTDLKYSVRKAVLIVAIIQCLAIIGSTWVILYCMH